MIITYARGVAAALIMMVGMTACKCWVPGSRCSRGKGTTGSREETIPLGSRRDGDAVRGASWSLISRLRNPAGYGKLPVDDVVIWHNMGVQPGVIIGRTITARIDREQTREGECSMQLASCARFGKESLARVTILAAMGITRADDERRGR
jgi:hypothetical protein